MSSSVMASLGQAAAKVGNAVKGQAQQQGKERAGHYFQSPPPPLKGVGAAEAMPEWKLNSLCSEYGLPANVRGHLPMGGCF